jgi:hypothetical protein
LFKKISVTAGRTALPAMSQNIVLKENIRGGNKRKNVVISARGSKNLAIIG